MLKGKEMKTHSLATQPSADGGVGECFSPLNSFGVSEVNCVCWYLHSGAMRCIQGPSEMLNLEDISRHLGFITWCKWPCLESNMNIWGCGHLDYTTGAVWRHVRFFSVVFLCLKFTYTFNCIRFGKYLAAALFTPETPELFFRLKHSTHPSIGIGVRSGSEIIIFGWTILLIQQNTKYYVINCLHSAEARDAHTASSCALHGVTQVVKQEASLCF